MTIPASTPAPIKAKWTAIAAAKVAARDALIPKEWLIPSTNALNVLDVPKTCGLLTPSELAITETEAPELVEKLLSRELKSYDVTLAFCKRAAIAQQLIFFDEALAYAKKIDEEYASSKTPLGPLHGLPVSLKDNFNVKSYDSTIGFITMCNKPKETESEMTKLLREQGAVLFCKTNVPTAMMMPESYNNVWGYTTNPANRDTTAGGSSGGEGALLALKGAPIGVGTDIGGSIRIPSACCGIYGLKPSFGRFPTYGVTTGMAGQEAVRSINGPMSASLGACELWAKTVVDSKPWERDPNMIPIPWRIVDLPKKLCFGIIMDDGLVKPTPPVTRALLETKAALEAAGHTVIEWIPYKPELAKWLLDTLFGADGGSKIAKLIEEGPEPWPVGMKMFVEFYEKSKKSAPPSASSIWDVQVQRTAYAKKVLEQWIGTKEVTGTGRPIDGLLSPASAYSASPKYSFVYVGYTGCWNLTDQSSCVFPVTHAEKTDVKPVYEAKEGEEKEIWDRYDPEEVVGAPVSLQMITQRLEEEKSLELVKVAIAALAAAKSS